jgi:hypothetical protein
VTEPTPAAIEAALALIAETHPDADVLREGVAEAYQVDQEGGQVLYLSAARRASLTAGDPYATWVVTFRAGQAVQVGSFHSRACSTGDGTVASERG